MDLGDISFTCAVPKTLWIEDIILDLIKKLPPKLFDEIRPWCSIITQYPFIHKFTIAEAIETISKARNQRTVQNEPLFPTDCRYSEDNLNQFLKRKPIRIMIAGDTNSSFDEINKALAKDFNTYTISPEKLIINEIKQKSNFGKSLENIVKTGRGVPVWVVMKLLEHELDNEKYATKGFILTGFPIVSSLTTTSKKYNKNNEFHDLEDESPKDCIQRQFDFINSLGCRPDLFIYLDTVRYTKQFTEAIEIFQEFILLYFRENVIRIDCRIGTNAILSSIRNRFKYINFKVNYECFVMNESQDETMSIIELCDTEKVLPNYKWLISKFDQICPVDLYHGRLRLCDTKFPVRYLRNIFLFFSQKNRAEFIENPAKYMNLEPKCRLAVIGPHRTGKTTLSQYLARYLNSEIYKDHIEKSKESYKFADLTRELEESNEKLLQENERCKQKKAEEWTVCVLGVLNDILSEALKEISSKWDVFSTKHAYQSLQTSETSNSWTKAFLLDYLIFQKSFDNISSEDFLIWLESKPGLTYKQYVIDSAPLNLNFWKDLQIKDELPDCVFFLKVSSLEKLFDTYDYKHNLNCVNGKYISERLRSKFEDTINIEDVYLDVSQTTHNVNREPFERGSKPLIKQRYIKALKFIEEYEEVQNFLQANNVKCVDIDISKQTWTQSVLKALTEYFSIYQPSPFPMHDFFDNESDENFGSISSYSDILTNKENTESETGTFDNNYGYCLDWCPVSLNNQKILKKGNAQYSVEYKNKMYAVCSREHLAEFMLNPTLYSRCNKLIVPPPRIFILGISYKNKTNFAEYLAYSLNVQSSSYKQQPTALPLNEALEQISIQQFKDSYNYIKPQFLKDLPDDYKRGTVLVGLPFLWEQFNDLIQRDIYPECVVSFDDEEEMHQTFYRYFSRLNMMQALNMSNTRMDLAATFSHNFRAPSITSYIESLSETQKHDIEVKCLQLVQAFKHEILKMEEECLKLGIAILKVPKNYQLKKTVNSIVESINNHRHRAALFENVKQITMNESEVLLSSGCYRFSRFKYSCPVDVARLMTLNQFEGLSKQGKVYPCIYLDFVYFICGKKNLKDFMSNPLEFINTCNPPQMQNPITIAVFGVSKSGVSTICRTAAHEFGFKILALNDLNEKTDQAVIDLLNMERNSTPNGFILDNFPLTPTLLHEAALRTVDISVVLVVVSSFEKVIQNWLIQNRNLKTCPKESLKRLHKQFCKSLKAINCLRASNTTSLLNIQYIDGDANSWTIWEKVKNEIIRTTRCITSYKIKLIKNRCANLGYLNMFYDVMTFKRQINHFYCQACLSLGKLKAFKYFYVNVGAEFYTKSCQNLLNQPYGYTNLDIYKKFNFSMPFQTNEMIEPLVTQTKSIMCMFQYINIFYWACNDHTINFMLNTQKYFNDSEKLKPLYVPFLVVGYTKEYVAFQGYCPVSYKQGKFVRGALNLSVYYRKKVYLMSNTQNTHEFLMFPEKYRSLKFDISLLNQKSGIFRGLSENVISNVVHEASKLRPKHFALDGRLSAATFIALKLKCLDLSSKYNPYWNTTTRNFTKECKKLNEEVKKYQQKKDRIV
ncbi:adenylate kinase 9-like [Eupeodes corollae]|uniref:adenylate kinase 9-like n=1 Tax=Eupeodes corollae TaxID=290404 RepID=UPI0024916E8E|nr:adenylate kinase 9-like [Eupeodes corollae]